MNKRIALFCLIISLGFTQIQAQDKSSLNIDFKNKKDIQIDNFKKFSFQDKNNNTQTGKIKILNDSQFCFVNYFLEAVGPTFNLSDINKVYVEGNKKRYKIPVLGVIGISMVPGGIYFLIIREILRKKRVDKPNGLNGWVDQNNFDAKIVIEYPQA
jgi:hypothetical protein